MDSSPINWFNYTRTRTVLHDAACSQRGTYINHEILEGLGRYGLSQWFPTVSKGISYLILKKLDDEKMERVISDP